MDTKSEPDKDKTQNELTYTDEESDVENRTNQSYKAFDTGISSSDLNLTDTLFEEFKKTVFTSRPNIANLYSEHGNTPFYNYVKTHVRENRNKTIKNRKPELHKTLFNHIRKTLGTGIAESVIKQLKSNDSVSTVQHFAPISHPDTFNAVLENSLPYFDSNRPDLKNVLVFACAGVSFNNTKFPRGHLFHSYSNDGLSLNPFAFFGHTVDARPVIHHPPYGTEGIKESKNDLGNYQREGKISQETYQKLLKFIDEVYNSPHPLSQNDYVDQITITNYWMFKKLFEQFNKSKPNLIFLSQEKVVLGLILDHHISNETTIHRILFDQKYHELLEKHLEGVTGAFYKEKELGSFLFWGLPKDSKYRIQLWRNGNKLESKDKTYSVELTPKAIKEAIQKKELIPSVMLTFFVFSLYYGLILGGGYEQTYYLTQTKNNYLKLLAETGDQESIDACEGLVTRNLVIPRPLLTYLEAPGDLRIPATGLDTYLYGDSGKSWGRILAASKNVTLGEIIERTLPSIYREYCKDAANFETLSRLAERDIEKFRGLDKKIPPIDTFS